MKHMLKLSLVALFSACGLVSTLDAKHVLIRSQSEDSARELVGWTNHINLYDMGCFYGTFAITPEYTRSFRDARIARTLFGAALGTSCDNDCDSASFNVSGSCVSTRGAFDLLADNFGLPTDFQSTVTISPRIENFLVDFNLYLGLDEYLCGLWFRIHAPVVWARWNLNYCENITAAGVNGYDAGYFAPTAVTRANLLNSFGSYLSGNVPNLGSVVTFQPLAHDLVGCTTSTTSTSSCNTSCSTSCDNSCTSGRLTKTRLSDIQMALGWNFWQDEDYHVGLGLRVHAPTGTRITNKYLFEPQIGNGHHWEVGAMFTSHYTFWRSCDYDQSFGVYVDLNVTHEFETKQCRTFDLCGRGDNSKYMLLEKLGTPVVNHLGGDAAHSAGASTGTVTAATSQFKNVFTPAANVAFAQVKVSIPVQADLSVMFNYTHCGFAWDLGYNLWATSCEKLKTCGNTAIIDANTWAVKGDAYVYGFGRSLFTSPSTQAAVALSATQTGASCGSSTSANIYSGANTRSTGCTTASAANPNIDNASFAYGDPASSTGTANDALFVNTTTTTTQTRTSIQPIFLADTDLDVNSARSKGLSNKIFTHFSYTWEDCDCWVPYLGIGGKVEFAQNTKCDTDCNTGCTTATSPVLCPTNCGSFNSSCSSTDCNDNGCARTNISEWGIWLKGGVSFN